MIFSNFEIISAFIILMALPVIIFFIFRKNKAAQKISLSAKSRAIPLPFATPQPIVPFKGITFRELLEVERSSVKIRSNVLNEIETKFNALPGMADYALKIVDFAVSKDVIRVVFSPERNEMLKSGAARLMQTKGGKNLAVAIDSKTGRTIEQAKEFDFTKLGQLAELTSFIVSASHIIAGWDNARTLKRIEKKLDQVIANRMHDKDGELESIFESIKEVMADGELDLQTDIFVRSMILKLKSLRSSFLSEIRSSLLQIEKPGDHWSITKKLRKKALSDSVWTTLDSQQDLMIRAGLCITLEQNLQTWLGEYEIYKTETVPSIVKQMFELEALVIERERWANAYLENPSKDGSVLYIQCKSFDSLKSPEDQTQFFRSETRLIG